MEQLRRTMEQLRQTMEQLRRTMEQLRRTMEQLRQTMVKLVTLISVEWYHLLFAADGRRRVYDKKAQRYAEDDKT